MLSPFLKLASKGTPFLKISRKFSHINTWHESEIFTEKKSKFQGHSVPLESSEDIPSILHQFLDEHKNIARSASHPHIIAWRTGKESIPTSDSTGNLKLERKLNKHNTYTNIEQGFKDNGEKGAGTKLLDLLIKNNIMNVMVIVTRWYGGNPIGSRRFRCINNCAIDSLKKSRKIQS